MTKTINIPGAGGRNAGSIMSLLPDRQYPHLRKIIHEVGYICGNCSAAEGYRVYRTFAESKVDPLNGPGQYTTRYMVRCPDCQTIPIDGDFVNHGIIDLLQVPKDYKKPVLPSAPKDGTGVQFETDFDEDDAPMLRETMGVGGTSAASSQRSRKRRPTSASKQKKRRQTTAKRGQRVSKNNGMEISGSASKKKKATKKR